MQLFIKHDYSASEDLKILELKMLYRDDFPKAYGTYWLLLESMAKTSTGDLQISKLHVFCYAYHLDLEWLQELVKNLIQLDIFVADEGSPDHFTSIRLQASKAEIKQLSEEKRRAAHSRWSKKKDNVSHPDNQEGNAPALQMQSRSNAIREDKIREDKIREDIFIGGKKENDGAGAPEQPKPKPQKQIHFKPPSEAEVQEYLTKYLSEKNQEHCLPRAEVWAAIFCDHYLTKGWKIKGQSMKDWKAAARNWVRSGWFENADKGTQGPAAGSAGQAGSGRIKV